MPRTLRSLIALLALLAGPLPPGRAGAQVLINELMAENDSFIEDPDEAGAFEDWIELHNAGADAVHVGGMYLTDDPGDPRRWRIPVGAVIPGGGRIVFWADGEPEQGDRHANFKLGADGEELCLFDRDGITRLDLIEFGPQESDVSLGRFPDGGDRWLVMREPTPGRPNSIGEAGVPSFSAPGGTFTEAFELELAADPPDAAIYYTLDGAEPTAEAGVRYAEPIAISDTTRVRARIIEDGLLPGPLVSRVFIALAPDVQAFESNLPIVVVDTRGVDIDAETSRPRRFRPVLAAVIETSEETGRAAITAAAEYSGPGGLHVRGASTVQYPKKQYAFETWDERDGDRAVSLLELPRESDWVLQAPYSDKTLMRNHLMYTWSNRIGRYAPRTRFCEVFMRRPQGPVSADDYRGVYVFMEKIKRDRNRVAIAELEPADDSEPEITGGYLLKKDWRDGEPFFTTATYRDNLIYVDPEGAELTAAQRTWVKGHFDEFEAALAGPDFADAQAGYAPFIDVDSFIDHHLLVELARNVDGFVLSTFLHKDRGGKITMGPIWDYNGSLGGANYFCSCQVEGWHHEFDERTCGECAEGGATFPADNPSAYRWYERLFEDPAFGRRYAERWAELRGGPLRTEILLEDVDDAVGLLTDGGAADSPVTRNFARWRILDRFVWPNFFVSGTYDEHVGWMVEWLAGRLAWMDGALVVPPVLSPPGGEVDPGTEVTMSAAAGEILYTIDGPDPRADSGEPAAEAVRYSGPVAIAANTRIRARVHVGGDVWSEMVEAIYITDAVELAVTEIMYDPAAPPEGSPFTRRNFEFLELFNAGDREAVLDGLRFVDRFRFEFTESAVTALPPGGHLLLVQNREAFASRYGDAGPIAGEYDGILANSSQEILLEGPVGEEIIRFTYRNWYPSTDGEGHSLVLVDPRSPRETWSDAEAWRPSAEAGGSPGRADGPSPGGLLRPGDLDGDGRLGISDPIGILAHLFQGGRDLPCASAGANLLLADLNGDGKLDLADAVRGLGYLFLGGPPPVLGTECRRFDACPETCGG